MKLTKQSYKCFYSGIQLKQRTFVLDHVQPLAAGGGHVTDNLVFVDPRINAMKGTLSADEFVTLCKHVANTHKASSVAEALTRLNTESRQHSEQPQRTWNGTDGVALVVTDKQREALEALESCGGSVAKASSLLHITDKSMRDRLWAIVKKNGLSGLDEVRAAAATA